MNNDEANRNRRNNSGEPSVPDNGIHPAVDTLSEYLDRPSGLTQAERETIDRHLASCAECQAVLADLRLMVRALGSLPEMAAPRSFAITPEMLEPATPPVVLRESTQWHARHAAKVRWATAVAAALFVFVISADLVTNGLRGGVNHDDTADSGAQTEQLRYTEAPAATGAEEAATAGVTEDAAGQSDETAGDSEEPEAEATPASASGAQAEGGSEATAEDDADVSTFSLPSDDAEAVEETPQTESALSAEAASTEEEPASDAAVRGDADELNWRIVEVSLALILALLLAVMIGLPKQGGRRP